MEGIASRFLAKHLLGRVSPALGVHGGGRGVVAVRATRGARVKRAAAIGCAKRPQCLGRAARRARSSRRRVKAGSTRAVAGMKCACPLVLDAALGIARIDRAIVAVVGVHRSARDVSGTRIAGVGGAHVGVVDRNHFVAHAVNWVARVSRARVAVVDFRRDAGDATPGAITGGHPIAHRPIVAGRALRRRRAYALAAGALGFVTGVSGLTILGRRTRRGLQACFPGASLRLLVTPASIAARSGRCE